jgi:hypothetical protein
MKTSEVRQMVCSLILATDMSFHHSMLRDLKEVNCKTVNKIFPEEEKEVII